ncbi:MAG: hypothetical protein GY861_08265, partial [bacterium]|nr:hypothetical protein [bacterium]
TGYEWKFVHDKSGPIEVISALDSTKRFIDDIIAINLPEFCQIAARIYPNSIPLEITSSRQCANYLDCTITITNDGIPMLDIYDKMDAYNFRVTKYGFASSNVHSGIGLRVFYGQALQFARIANKLLYFEKRLADLVMTFIEHGYQRPDLVAQFFRLAIRHKEIFLKFGIIDKMGIQVLVCRVFGC